MSEIYKDSTNSALAFDVIGANVETVEFYREDELVKTINSSTVAPVPYEITRKAGVFTVVWTYTVNGDGPYERTETHSVITPMFTKSALVAWDSDFSVLSDAKVVYLESLVRQIIEVYTGQKFDLFRQSVAFSIAPNGVYYSPEKVVSLDNARYTLGDGGYSVHNLETYTSQGYNVKIPIEAESYEINKGWHAPKPPKTVVVTGDFGWASIPPNVKNAALYLAESFTCDESLWRERLIKSVRAADWRFDFSEEAFHSTGSLFADQLLDPFVRRGYAAV